MKKIFQKRLLLLILPALLFSGCAAADSQEKTAAGSTPETETASSSKQEENSMQIDFESTDMDGNSVSSDVFSESELTMVNVWATYCNPCLNEMPGLGELSGAYDPKEFQIIGIISDVQEGADSDTMALAANLIAQTNADYTHLLLNESLYLGLLTDVTAVPTTFFIDKNGAILDTVVGAMEQSAWEEKINALLEE